MGASWPQSASVHKRQREFRLFGAEKAPRRPCFDAEVISGHFGAFRPPHPVEPKAGEATKRLTSSPPWREPARAEPEWPTARPRIGSREAASPPGSTGSPRNVLIDVARRDDRQEALKDRSGVDELALQAALQDGGFERASQARILHGRDDGGATTSG